MLSCKRRLSTHLCGENQPIDWQQPNRQRVTGRRSRGAFFLADPIYSRDYSDCVLCAKTITTLVILCVGVCVCVCERGFVLFASARIVPDVWSISHTFMSLMRAQQWIARLPVARDLSIALLWFDENVWLMYHRPSLPVRSRRVLLARAHCFSYLQNDFTTQRGRDGGRGEQAHGATLAAAGVKGGHPGTGGCWGIHRPDGTRG